jgi:hypothetical protein
MEREPGADEVAVAQAVRPTTMPDCVQTLVYGMSFDTVHTRRVSHFTFNYRKLCVQVYEHVCKTRLVCRESAKVGRESVEFMKKQRVRAHRHEINACFRLHGRRWMALPF